MVTRADRRIGVPGQRSAQEQITTDSAYIDDEFRNPGFHVYRSYLDGVDWRDWVHLKKDSRCGQFPRVLQEARTAPSFQHASVAERDKAANCPPSSFNYGCAVGLVGALARSYLT